jgi:hypothetical protein
LQLELQIDGTKLKGGLWRKESMDSISNSFQLHHGGCSTVYKMKVNNSTLAVLALSSQDGGKKTKAHILLFKSVPSEPLLVVPRPLWCFGTCWFACASCTFNLYVVR